MVSRLRCVERLLLDCLVYLIEVFRLSDARSYQLFEFVSVLSQDARQDMYIDRYLQGFKA